MNKQDFLARALLLGRVINDGRDVRTNDNKDDPELLAYLDKKFKKGTLYGNGTTPPHTVVWRHENRTMAIATRRFLFIRVKEIVKL